MYVKFTNIQQNIICCIFHVFPIVCSLEMNILIIVFTIVLSFSYALRLGFPSKLQKSSLDHYAHYVDGTTPFSCRFWSFSITMTLISLKYCRKYINCLRSNCKLIVTMKIDGVHKLKPCSRSLVVNKKMQNYLMNNFVN
jgi:hypothetical protein